MNGHEQAQAMSHQKQTQHGAQIPLPQYQQEGVPNTFAPPQRDRAKIAGSQADSQKPPSTSTHVRSAFGMFTSAMKNLSVSAMENAKAQKSTSNQEIPNYQAHATSYGMMPVKFSVGAKVQAYWKDSHYEGWFPGVVDASLPDGYMVTFSDYPRWGSCRLTNEHVKSY
jgi:hypothetical protein